MLQRLEVQLRMWHATNVLWRFAALCVLNQAVMMIEPPICVCRCLLLEFPSTWVDIQPHNTCHHSDCCDELCDKLQEVYAICRAWWRVWWVTVWMLKVLDRMRKFGDQEVNYPTLLCVQDDPSNTSIANLLVCQLLCRVVQPGQQSVGVWGTKVVCAW